MAQISVNDEYIVNGKLTVQRSLTDDGEIVIIGTFATHLYFEEIKKLETSRYQITGIEVREETFGSDDFDIVYSFIADEILNIYGMSNITPSEIQKIENELYNEQGFLHGSYLDRDAEVIEFE